MRTSKKIVSLILAVLMVVSMMSVMAVSVSAATAVSDLMGLYNACASGGDFELTGNVSTIAGLNLVGADFTLDGNGYTITNSMKSGALFGFSSKTANITLVNLTIDLNQKAGVAVQAYTSGDSENVITLRNCTIKNMNNGNDGIGAVHAFGGSSVILDNCTFVNNSPLDVFMGGAGELTIEGNSSIDTVLVNGGTATAEIKDTATVGEITTADKDAADVLTIADTATVECVFDQNGINAEMSDAVIITTAAEFVAAIEAAPSGSTVKLLADIDFSELTTNRNAHDRGEEIKIDLKDLTLDMGGHTITSVNATVVYTGNGATIENGNFALNHVKADGVTYQAGSYGICIDGYGVENSITLNNVTVEGGINVWNANVEINDATAQATASNFYAIWAEGDSNVVVNSGTFSDNGNSNARGPIATDTDTPATTVTIKGGTFNATNKVVNASATGSVQIEGGTFSDDSAYKYVANDAFVIKDAAGNTVVSDTMPDTATAIEADDQLGVSAQNITNHAILGYQNFAETNNAAGEYQDCVRIVTAVNEGFLKGDNIADYGYVVAKYNGDLSNADLSTPMANILKYNNDNFKRISCYGTSNTVATEAAYGDFNADSTYKYVTLAVGDMSYGDKVIARFYIKTKDGKVYYSQYQTYSGILATYMG